MPVPLDGRRTLFERTMFHASLVNLPRVSATFSSTSMRSHTGSVPAETCMRRRSPGDTFDTMSWRTLVKRLFFSPLERLKSTYLLFDRTLATTFFVVVKAFLTLRVENFKPMKRSSAPTASVSSTSSRSSVSLVSISVVDDGDGESIALNSSMANATF